MRVDEVTGKIAQWYKDNYVQPDVPTGKLYHATLTVYESAIMRQGLKPDGECKMYDGCGFGHVYLATQPRTAVSFVADDQSGINQESLAKHGAGGGTLFEIDSSKLNSKLFADDENWNERDWWSMKDFTYRYGAPVPPSAIRVAKRFGISLGYYNQKQVRDVR